MRAHTGRLVAASVDCARRVERCPLCTHSDSVSTPRVDTPTRQRPRPRRDRRRARCARENKIGRAPASRLANGVAPGCVIDRAKVCLGPCREGGGGGPSSLAAGVDRYERPQFLFPWSFLFPSSLLPLPSPSLEKSLSEIWSAPFAPFPHNCAPDRASARCTHQKSFHCSSAAPTKRPCITKPKRRGRWTSLFFKIGTPSSARAPARLGPLSDRRRGRRASFGP